MAFSLPRLPPGVVSPEFQIWWQEVVEAIEAQEGVQNDLIADLASAVTAVVAAQADATAAARETARINSYTNPGGVLSAADVGSDATITVAAHTRVYPVQGTVDVPDVAISGGTITGQPFSTRVYVYYDDLTLANIAPTFHATTVAADAQVGAAAGRHSLGFVDTPTDGGAASSGGGTWVPGGGGGRVGNEGQLP